MAAIALLAALVACTGDGEPRSDGPSSTTSVPHLGPGTELTAGLNVPPGARLLGRVFPDAADFGVVRGVDPWTAEWLALLLVEGDGRRSYDGLVGQARVLGWADDPERLPPSCDGPADCHASLTRGGARIEVDLVVGSCQNAQGASHIVLSGSGGAKARPTPTTRTIEAPPPTDPSSPGTTSVGRSGPTTTSTTSPTTAPPFPLPGPGELLNDRGHYEAAPVRLEPGSRVAGPPMVACDNSSSHHSVIVFDAPVEELVDAYARQWVDYSGDDGIIQTETLGDVRLTLLTVDEGSGDYWYLTVAEEPGQPTLGFVTSYST